MSLTLKDTQLQTSNKDLHKFLTFLTTRLKRANQKMYYAWVVELQKKRYYRYGDKALHWHFAVVAPQGALPDVEYVKNTKYHYKVKTEGLTVTSKDLFKRWGRGQAFCCYAKTNLVMYLSKYLNKDYGKLESYNHEWSKLRRFGASQLSYNQYPKWAYEQLNELKSEGVPVESLIINKTGSTVKVFAYEHYPEWDDVDLGWRKHKRKPDGTIVKLKYDYSRYKRLLYEIRSPWRVIGLMPWQNSTQIS